VERGPAGLSLIGAAGSGRSRLCCWLCEELEQLGRAVSFHLRVEPGDTAVLALIRAVRRMLGLNRLPAAQFESRLAARAAGLGLADADVAELAAWLNPVTDRTTLVHFPGSGGLRLRLVASLLRGLASRGRLVAWIEDGSGDRQVGAQLASSLLRIASLEEVPLLLLHEPPGEGTAAEGLTPLVVGPLSDAHIAEILADLIPFEDGAEAETRRARGNPGRAVECARLLAARRFEQQVGTVATPEGQPRTQDGSTGLESTRSIRDIVRARLDDFAAAGRPDAREDLLALLALLPRPCLRVDLDAAWAAAREESEELASALDAAQRAGLVRQTEDGGFDLCGAAVERATAEHAAEHPRRAALARACARALLVEAEPDAARRLDAARLYSMAGDAAESVEQAVVAGRGLEGRDAVAASAAWELALRGLQRSGTDESAPIAVAVAMGAARLARASGDLAAAEERLETLEFDRIDPEQRGDWRELRASLHLVRGQGREALAEARSAVDLHAARGDQAGRSRSLLLCADALWRTGESVQALPLFEQALRVARDAGAEREELVARWRLARARLRLGGRDAQVRRQVQQELEAALELARRLRSGQFEGIVLRELGNLAVHEGRGEDADELLRRSVEQLRRCGLDGEAATTRISLGELARSRGDLEAARREYSVALGVTRAFGITQDALVALIDLAITELGLGRSASVARRVREIDQLLPPGEAHAYRPWIEAVRFASGCALGRWEDADEQLERLLAQLEGVDADPDLVSLVERAADAAASGQEPGLAVEVWEAARRMAEARGDADTVARMVTKLRSIR
jgi:tetratricopeptide (TPR) repeat protein